MWVSFIVLIALVIVAILSFVLGIAVDDDDFLGFSGVVAFISVAWFLIITLFTCVGIPTGQVGVISDAGGKYTGQVIEKSGLHFFAAPMSYDVKNVDIRNDKTAVKVNVMKDQTYNVSAKIEVVYDLNPDKVVDLLSNNSDYKNTVIAASVKQVVTSNNSLANSQSLTADDEKQIENKLKKYGVIVTNIYMDSYKLTNSSNFAMNANVNGSN